VGRLDVVRQRRGPFLLVLRQRPKRPARQHKRRPVLPLDRLRRLRGRLRRLQPDSTGSSYDQYQWHGRSTASKVSTASSYPGQDTFFSGQFIGDYNSTLAGRPIWTDIRGADAHYPGYEMDSMVLGQVAPPPPSPPPPPPPPPPPVTVRVNAGGPAYTDTGGNAWSADCCNSGGNIATTTAATSGTSDPTLYKDERWYTGSFTYTFTGLTGGTYKVTLKFAEIAYLGPGKRQFNVTINGTQVLTNFDVASLVGFNKALDKTFTATVASNGQLTQSPSARAPQTTRPSAPSRSRHPKAATRAERPGSEACCSRGPDHGALAYSRQCDSTPAD
jgi:hypothetical protein